MSPKRNPKFKSPLFLLIPTSTVEGRDTYGPRELVCNTLFHKIPKVCVQRERKRQIGTHLFQKKRFASKKNENKIKKFPVRRAQDWGALLPC